MPYRTFLSRIQKLFGVVPNAHFESIAGGFESGQLQAPAHPMTDQELARALREFRSRPVSDWTLRKLRMRFKGN